MKWVAIVLLRLAGCAGPGPPGGERLPTMLPMPPSRPASCTQVAATAALQPILDSASDGATLCLAPGVYRGPIRIAHRLALWGPPGAIIRSTGQGTTVTIAARGASLLGVTVDGSGGRFDLLDSAVHVVADEARVEGVRIVNAVFGVLVERAHGVTVRGCHVVGVGGESLGLRGDGIRLWETSDSMVTLNLVEQSRDVVVWYSVRNRFVGNTVRGGRYGTHLMYSSGSTVEDNRYLGNVVGLFIMYTSDVRVRGNLMADATGAAGLGLGLKESGNVDVTANRMIRNTSAIYIDTSPLSEGQINRFTRNRLQFGDVGVTFHSSPRANVFEGNCFLDNRQAVEVEGGGDALGIGWVGNYFDDYAGYDLDGDGVGDVPYELRSLSGEMASRYPDLAFFRGTPSLSLIDAASHALPLLQPRTLLRDAHPQVAPSCDGNAN